MIAAIVVPLAVLVSAGAASSRPTARVGGPSPAADLSVVATAGKSVLTADNPLPTVLTVHNGGPDDATGVTLSDALPVSMQIAAVTPSQGSCTAGAPVSCSLGTLAAGADATVDVSLVPVAPGNISAADASVSSDLFDSDPSNNTSSVTVKVWPGHDTKYVAVGDTAMTPSTVSISPGWTVQWNFFGSNSHDVTDSTGLGLFASGSHAPGSYYQHTFDFAGGYTYTSSEDIPGFGGVVKVVPVVTPARGTLSMRYQLGLTAVGVAPPPGLVFDVQLQRPGAAYTNYARGTTVQSLDFGPDAGNGTYQFRVQLRASDDAKSEYVSSSLVADPNNPLQWVHQLGSTANELGNAIAVDADGNSYITGSTFGTLPGSPEANAGNFDVFVAKYDSRGNRLWVRQLGTNKDDSGNGIGVDRAGNSYITGTTLGRLPGSPERGSGFIAKYDTDGNIQWVHEFNLMSEALAVDGAGNSYVTGERESSVSTAFVAKYDTSGHHQWTRMLANATVGQAIAVDAAGNSYLTGDTVGGLSLSTINVFVAKYDTNGNRQWIQQFGSPSFDDSRGIAVDAAGNSYLTGATNGTLPGSPEPNAGSTDVFIAKYDTNGNRQWVHEFGSRYDDGGGFGVAVDAAGNSDFIGSAYGTFPGNPQTTESVYVARYDTNGNRQSVDLFGSPGDSPRSGIGIDPDGNSYIVGSTGGTLPGSPETNAGGLDVFVAKYLHTG